MLSFKATIMQANFHKMLLSLKKRGVQKTPHRLIVFPLCEMMAYNHPKHVKDYMTRAAQKARWCLRLKKKCTASHKLRPLAANASLCFEASHARLCRMARPTQTIPHLPICISQTALRLQRQNSQPERCLTKSFPITTSPRKMSRWDKRRQQSLPCLVSADINKKRCQQVA